MSPARRRQAVAEIRATLPQASERRVCKVLGHSRTTQRYTPRVSDDDVAIADRVVEVATSFGAYGYRMITGLLNGEGWDVNHKRVERIWRMEGLKVPQKQPKRERLWFNDGSCVRLRPTHKDHVWSYDFVQDRTHDGRSFRMLTIVDEFTRECLAIDVARKLRSDDVLERLTWLFVTRGVPENIRSDNGPEFVAKNVVQWLDNLNVTARFITPGSPWENGYVESFNGTLRRELLDRELFYTLREAKVLIERWRVFYNTLRPHSALRYRPPAPESVTRIIPTGTAYGRDAGSDSGDVGMGIGPCSAALRRNQSPRQRVKRLT